MKIVTVVGARPQFIKAATVSRAFASRHIAEIIIHTGQHFDPNMSDVFFAEMGIPIPHIHLDINNLSHGAMTGRMVEKIEQVLITEKPDCVVVYGDTNSTLAGALAAAKLHIPVAHVEAGLRSYDMNMPEEINRILTDRISKFLFCPTRTAFRNLEREGFRHFDCHIEQPGDVMYDAMLFYRKKALKLSTILIKETLSRQGFVLATLHREENTTDPGRLKSICKALNEIHKTLPLVLPLHPRTRTYLESQGISLEVKTIEPVGYFDMLMLLENCRLVLTDSGGLQKEAYLSGKFCITLRDQTEWVELVKAGATMTVGASTKKIVSCFRKNQDKVIPIPIAIGTFGTKALYGAGDAAEKIVKKLLQLL